MAEFPSWRSYWKFHFHVARQRRYIHDPETRRFLECVLETSTTRERILEKGRLLWRAQLGNSWEPCHSESDTDDCPAPYPPERMVPLRDGAAEGRVNPKGIPCLYLATTKETAMAEVRPWVGSHISVGQFLLLRDQRIIDCSIHERATRIYLEEPGAAERERKVWSDIDRAFSRPVTPSDRSADYVPTQILAELFRSQGYDGVLYMSALGSGYNVALFDLDAADVINCSLFEARGIHFAFDEAANPYFRGKYYNGGKFQPPDDAADHNRSAAC